MRKGLGKYWHLYIYFYHDMIFSRFTSQIFICYVITLQMDLKHAKIFEIFGEFI